MAQSELDMGVRKVFYFSFPQSREEISTDSSIVDW